MHVDYFFLRVKPLCLSLHLDSSSQFLFELVAQIKLRRVLLQARTKYQSKSHSHKNLDQLEGVSRGHKEFRP